MRKFIYTVVLLAVSATGALAQSLDQARTAAGNTSAPDLGSIPAVLEPVALKTACLPNSYQNLKPPANPEAYQYYYYGFKLAGVCSAAGAADPAEAQIAKAHPEGYYVVVMKSYIQTASKTINDAGFALRTFDAGADREKVERTIARALTAGPLGLPNGLSDSAQVKFGDTVLPLIAQVMELREAGDTAQAAAVRADALSKWIAILAAEAN